MQLSSPIRKKSLVNLTPLIDVVFILLIFFMLASNFTRWHTIEISMGEASEIELNSQTLSVIAINHDGGYLLNKKPMLLSEIISIIKAKIKTNSEHPIVIQPGKGANVQSMMNVLSSLKEFAGNNVSIAKPIETN